MPSLFSVIYFFICNEDQLKFANRTLPVSGFCLRYLWSFCFDDVKTKER